MNATPNGRGGWDLTDADAEEVGDASFPEDYSLTEAGGWCAPREDPFVQDLMASLSEPIDPADETSTVLACIPKPQPRTVPVSEVFPAWQGEGPATGRACTFVRTGLCNLHCSWCDTPFTWDKTRYDVGAECPPRTADWIVEQVRRHPARLLVLSGGEPLMHRANPALIDALTQLKASGYEIHVETNGTLAPTPQLAELVDLFAVSPKVAQDDDPLSKRIRPGVLRVYRNAAIHQAAVFKFVARTPADLDGIRAIVRDHDLPNGSVWVMPEGTTPDELTHRHRLLTPHLEETGFNTTTRLHVLLYGDQRGK